MEHRVVVYFAPRPAICHDTQPVRVCRSAGGAAGPSLLLFPRPSGAADLWKQFRPTLGCPLLLLCNRHRPHFSDDPSFRFLICRAGRRDPVNILPPSRVPCSSSLHSWVSHCGGACTLERSPLQSSPNGLAAVHPIYPPACTQQVVACPQRSHRALPTEGKTR